MAEEEREQARMAGTLTHDTVVYEEYFEDNLDEECIDDNELFQNSNTMYNNSTFAEAKELVKKRLRAEVFTKKKFYIKLLENYNFMNGNNEAANTVGYSTNELEKICRDRDLQTCEEKSSLIKFLVLDDKMQSLKLCRAQLQQIILQHEDEEQKLE